MKFIHTADWHLGNIFHGHRRVDEHVHFFDWLLAQIEAHQPDALLVTGDVFDMANPSADAERAYYNFLSRASALLPGMNIIIIAGNHDSAARLEAPAALLADRGIFVVGTPRVDEKREPNVDPMFVPLTRRGEEVAACVVFAVPYLRSTDYPTGLTPEEGLRLYFDKLHQMHRQSGFRSLPIIVAGHFYAGGAEMMAEGRSERIVVGGADCVNANVVGREGVSYVALGHIHRQQILTYDPMTAYSGSALPMSFSEKHYRHSVNLVELDHEGAPLVQQLHYEPQRTLMTIPEQGACTAEEALRLIEQLPTRKAESQATDPYLEIRIAETHPQPELAHTLFNALAPKAVRFCAIKRERTGRDEAIEAPKLTIDELRTIEPLAMAERLYLDRFGEAMPEALALRFNRALEDALDETAKEEEV